MEVDAHTEDQDVRHQISEFCAAHGIEDAVYINIAGGRCHVPMHLLQQVADSSLLRWAKVEGDALTDEGDVRRKGRRTFSPPGR